MTIIQEMRLAKAMHRVEQSRRSGYFKPVSNLTLNLMEDIVKADIQYDRKHRIDYTLPEECDGGAA
jgi:hypothetical protein